MYFHVYLIYRFTRTFTDHSSVITRCWGFELQNGKSSLKSPQTLATQDFAPASFLSTPDNLEDLKSCDFESSFLLSQTFRSVSKCRTISVSNGFLTDSSTRAMQTVGQLLRQSLFAGIVQMTINVCCHLNIAVTHPFLYILEVAAVIQKQTGAAMPLRYNYDKPEKPRISRVFGYLARFFILFQTEKSSREVVIS